MGSFYGVKKRRIEEKEQTEEYKPTIPEEDPNFKFYNPQHSNLEETSPSAPETENEEEEIDSLETEIYSYDEEDTDSDVSDELEL